MIFVNSLTLTSMPPTHKQAGTGATKDCGKVENAQKPPVWNIEQVIASRFGMNGASWKASVVHDYERGEVHHFVKHVIV